MFTTRGIGGFFLGVVALAVGIAATLYSYQQAAPGGTYIIFIGLIFGGLLRIFMSIVGIQNTVPRRGTSWRSGSAASHISSKLVAFPEDMPPGYCWQCGRKVNSKNTICLNCGATQTKLRAIRLNDKNPPPAPEKPDAGNVVFRFVKRTFGPRPKSPD